MAEIIIVDFLFARMCRDIKSWYDKYYLGIDKEEKKYEHLNRLEVLYETLDISTWDENPVLLNQQVEEFLTYVQGKVNGYAIE